MRVQVQYTTEIELDVETAAKWFTGLSDEQQADFFIGVQRESLKWDGRPETQWYYMSRHLAECGCSNAATRDMIRYWAETVGEEEF